MKVRLTANPQTVLTECNTPANALLARSRSTVTATVVNIQKILVPVDFSVRSSKALEFAIPFARQFGAQLTLLHVIEPYYAVDPYGLSQIERVEGELRQEAEQKLARLLAADVASQIKTDTLLRYGRPADEIVDTAKTLHADLIVISTHGHTGLKHVMFGSTAESVVRHASCPVLTVRETKDEFTGN